MSAVDGNDVEVSIWLTLLGIFLAVVTPLIGIIYWRQRGDIAHLHVEIKALWIKASAYEAFRSFDSEREKHWTLWRGGLEGQLKEIEKRFERIRQSDTDWKHDHYGPRIGRIELDLARLKDKLGIGGKGDE